MALRISLPFPAFAFENMLLATFFWATTATLVKGVSTEIPHVVVVFLRGTLGCLITFPFLWAGQGKSSWLGFSKHIPRGFCGAGSLFCYYYAIRHLFVEEAILLRSTAPLFAPWLSYVFIGERMTSAVFLGLVLGM